MINNFLNIHSLLDFSNSDYFYFVQIIKRRKDNLELKNQISIKDRFLISSIDEYVKLRRKIIEICDRENARAYISLNPRSYKKCAFETLKLISEDIYNESYKNVKNAYYSACGKFAAKKKYWFIDFDEKWMNEYKEITTRLEEVVHPIQYI